MENGSEGQKGGEKGGGVDGDTGSVTKMKGKQKSTTGIGACLTPDFKGTEENNNNNDNNVFHSLTMN